MFTEIHSISLCDYIIVSLTKHGLFNKWPITTCSNWRKMKVGSTADTVYLEIFQIFKKYKYMYFCYTLIFYYKRCINNFVYTSLSFNICTGISLWCGIAGLESKCIFSFGSYCQIFLHCSCAICILSSNVWVCYPATCWQNVLSSFCNLLGEKWCINAVLIWISHI